MILLTGLMFGQCQSTPSDSSFPLDPGQGDSHGVVFSSIGQTTANLSVNRVVGPGTQSETDGSGYLLNWSDYVANGVLSPTAFLPVAWFCLERFPPTFTVKVYLNDDPKEIGIFTQDAYSSDFIKPANQCMEFSTKWVKFAKRNPGAAPTPGVNKITVWFSTPGVQDLDSQGRLYWVTHAEASVGYLSFKAMAPIVLVHGWNSGPWDWGDPATSSCLANPKPNNSAGQLNFVQAFIDAHAPFDCTVGLTLRQIRTQVLRGSNLSWSESATALAPGT